MKVLICDGPALIELSGGPLIATARGWKIKLAVPDIVCEREMGEATPEFVRRLGMRVEPLAAVEMERAIALRLLHPRLSLGDSCALALAAARSWILLAQNPTLERIAAESAVESRSIAWLHSQATCPENRSARLLLMRSEPSIKDTGLRYDAFDQYSM